MVCSAIGKIEIYSSNKFVKVICKKSITNTLIYDKLWVNSLYDYVDRRDVLDKWTDRKNAEELVAYRKQKNQLSIDGLPGLEF